MSRRDTIIIALLINAGLLAILFMLAVNVDEDVVPAAPKSAFSALEQPLEPVGTATSSEVALDTDDDAFLKQLKSVDSKRGAYVDDDEETGLEGESTKSEQPTPPAVQKSGYVEVKVKSGDALEKIARNNGTTVEAIKQANNLQTTKLSIGQTLRIPTNSKVASTEVEKAPSLTPAPKATQTLTPAPKPDKAPEPVYYTVKNGDSPWKIAKEMKIEVEDLLRLNNLDEAKARNLKVGDKIRVR